MRKQTSLWVLEPTGLDIPGGPKPPYRRRCGFATKPALGLQMLRRALDAGLPARWVTADEAYGKDSKFRLWLQSRRMSYVLAVAGNQKIPTDGGSARADELAAAAPAPAWKRRSCGAGANGPRLFDWAVATLPDTGTADHGFTRWLLIRRSITDPTEHAYRREGEGGALRRVLSVELAARLPQP
ncbi:transposase [Micromonospora sp. NPDC005367]|uniref:transposase n=1 Tax=Micromonospora sp. NPDC005367 TaxID=3155590 RepID=UPI0033A41E9B